MALDCRVTRFRLQGSGAGTAGVPALFAVANPADRDSLSAMRAPGDAVAPERVRRGRVGVLLVGVLLALLLTAGAPPAFAADADPSPLWEEFPLEPDPMPTPDSTPEPTSTPAPGAAGTTPMRTPEPAGEQDDGVNAFTIVSLLVLAAGLGAAGVSFARGPAGPRRERAALAGAREPEPPRAAQPPLALVNHAAPQRESRFARKPQAAVSAPPAPPPPPAWEQCTIRLWEGYVKRQFYAEAPDGRWLAQSPFFRLQKGRTVQDSEQAADALRALIEGLESQGWERGEAEGTDAMLRRRVGVEQPVDSG